MLPGEIIAGDVITVRKNSFSGKLWSASGENIEHMNANVFVYDGLVSEKQRQSLPLSLSLFLSHWK